MGRIQTCMQVVEGQASQLVTGILQKPVYRVFLPMMTARVPCACATGPASMSPSLPESSCAESGDFQAGTRWKLRRDHLHLMKLIHFGSLSSRNIFSSARPEVPADCINGLELAQGPLRF